jgi:hypothetical protein
VIVTALAAAAVNVLDAEVLISAPTTLPQIFSSAHAVKDGPQLPPKFKDAGHVNCLLGRATVLRIGPFPKPSPPSVPTNRVSLEVRASKEIPFVYVKTRLQYLSLQVGKGCGRASTAVKIDEVGEVSVMGKAIAFAPNWYVRPWGELCVLNSTSTTVTLKERVMDSKYCGVVDIVANK